MSAPNAPNTMTREDAILQAVLQQALALHEQTAAIVSLLTTLSMDKTGYIPPDSPLQRDKDGNLQRTDKKVPPRFGRPETMDPQPQGASDGRSAEPTA